MVNEFPLVIPPWFGLVLRSFGALEGLGLSVDKDYSIVQVKTHPPPPFVTLAITTSRSGCSDSQTRLMTLATTIPYPLVTATPFVAPPFLLLSHPTYLWDTLSLVHRNVSPIFLDVCFPMILYEFERH